jgi:hypothetical protein
VSEMRFNGGGHEGEGVAALLAGNDFFCDSKRHATGVAENASPVQINSSRNEPQGVNGYADRDYLRESNPGKRRRSKCLGCAFVFPVLGLIAHGL